MDNLKETNLPNLKLFRRGKVRDVYDLGEHLLVVATDRISAFDYVMKQCIPNKGKILNKITVFWFDHTKQIIPNHLITDDLKFFPEECKQYTDQLEDRTMLVKKAQAFPIEFVVRGYIAGSAWKEYQKSGTINGLELPPGLQEFEKLPEPLFTPSTKETDKHDENITFEKMANIIGEDYAKYLRDKSIELYLFAQNYIEKKGLILADTKFEFGLNSNGDVILIDEALTPDSSRYWAKSTYAVGVEQNNFDKQVLRDYLLSTNWDRNSEPPDLPEEIIQKTLAKYEEAQRIILY
ncbi:MAG: phosphoribosylaminoimidazolesuccinocarboxamide synthase [Candidatus Kapaibacteriota bacterium]